MEIATPINAEHIKAYARAYAERRIGEVIKAERERCAKIAEDARDSCSDNPGYSVADGIVTDIREGK